MLLVAIATPILGFKGALWPSPHDSSNYNWVALYWSIGILVLAAIWLVILIVARRDKIDGAAAHAAEHKGVAPLDESLAFQSTGETTRFESLDSERS